MNPKASWFFLLSLPAVPSLASDSIPYCKTITQKLTEFARRANNLTPTTRSGSPFAEPSLIQLMDAPEFERAIELGFEGTVEMGTHMDPLHRTAGLLVDAMFGRPDIELLQGLSEKGPQYLGRLVAALAATPGYQSISKDLKAYLAEGNTLSWEHSPDQGHQGTFFGSESKPSTIYLNAAKPESITPSLLAHELFHWRVFRAKQLTLEASLMADSEIPKSADTLPTTTLREERGAIVTEIKAKSRFQREQLEHAQQVLQDLTRDIHAFEQTHGSGLSPKVKAELENLRALVTQQSFQYSKNLTPGDPTKTSLEDVFYPFRAALWAAQNRDPSALISIDFTNSPKDIANTIAAAEIERLKKLESEVSFDPKEAPVNRELNNRDFLRKLYRSPNSVPLQITWVLRQGIKKATPQYRLALQKNTLSEKFKTKEGYFLFMRTHLLGPNFLPGGDYETHVFAKYLDALVQEMQKLGEIPSHETLLAQSAARRPE